jgi:hypothetical protein
VGGGSPWLVSEAYTLADINMVPYIARMEYLTLLDVWTADRPRVRDWWARAKARPSTVEAIPNRLTSDEIGEMREYGAAIHDDVARLRADYLRMFPSHH